MAGQIKIELNQISASTSEAQIRHHRVLVDRPAEKGGADSGPMGGELFLAAVGGCFMSNLLAAVKAREAEAFDVRTEVIGTIVDPPARFRAVDMDATAECLGRERLFELEGIAW